MRFFHRNRRSLSAISLLAFVFGMGASATPAAADYNAKFGRFLQTDPNGTGLILSPNLGYLGSNPTVTVSMAYQLQYGDGMNFYQYLRSNAVNRNDPSGLMSFGFDYLLEAGSITDDLIGQRLYALGAINEGAQWASLGLQTTLDIAGGLLNVDVFQSVSLLASGRGGFWDSANILLAVSPFAALAKVGGKLAKAFRYARRGSRGVDVAASAAKHLFKVLPYNQAQKLTRGWGGDIAAHHILEARHLRAWGRAGEAASAPAVILTRNQHRMITNELQSKLRTGVEHHRDEVWAVYQDVYTRFGFSDWLDEIEGYFR